MTRIYSRLAAALTLLAPLPAPCIAQSPDVVFVGTPSEAVAGMLRLAGVGDSDLVYDLGSGDGRIVIAAARDFGARAVGVEIDSNLVEESRRSADSAGVAARTDFRRSDLFRTDLRPASVVTLYLGRQLNERLRPILLRDLRPGSRVVSQNFDMGDWMPDSVIRVGGRNFAETPVHLWIIPADLVGTWDIRIEGDSDMSGRQVELEMRYQRITGPGGIAGTLRGTRLVLRLPDPQGELRLEGEVRGDTAEGRVTGARFAGRPWKATRPPRPRRDGPS
jgi:hypothetical protein